MPRLKDIKKVTAKGRTYYFFRTGQMNANGRERLSRLPDIDADNFGDVYGAHRAAKSRRKNTKAEVSVADLIDIYKRSPHFTTRAQGTQRIYEIYLAQLRDQLGEAPANLVERKDIALLIDTRAKTPGAANSLLRSLNAMWKWGRGRGHVTNDPGKDIAELDIGEWEPWPDHVLEALLASEDADVRLGTAILYYTALRINDGLGLRWSDIRGDSIYVTPQKTKRTRGEMQIPLHEQLKAELDATPKRGLTILANEAGKPFKEDYLRRKMQAEAAKFRVKIVPHGLRKNAVNALLECGCSVAETAAISNQSLQMVEHYARRRKQGKLASAAILKWQNKGGK
jgi:integrase